MSNILFKKICKDLNAFAATDDWRKPRCIRVEFTSFQPLHKAQRGRNGVGELVELQTQVIEAQGIHIEQSDRSNCVSVYVQSRTKTDHSFGSDTGVFMRLKDSKGKYSSIEVRTAWEESEIEVGGLIRVLGETMPCAFAPDEFKEFLEEKSSKVLKLVDKDDDGHSAWQQNQDRLQFSKRYYQHLVKYSLRDGDTEDLDKLLAFAGAKLVHIFHFTDRFAYIVPKYLDQVSRGVEIGWMTHSTYNSLPCTLRITKALGIKMIKLAELGVETAGYYSHNDQMRVLPEHAGIAKRFGQRFKAKAQGMTNQIVRQALRKAG